LFNICRIAKVRTIFVKEFQTSNTISKYTPLYQRLNIMKFKVSLMKRNLHEIKLSPLSSLMKQNMVPNTCYIAWYCLIKFSNIHFPPTLYIEFFKILPQINIRYPICYCTSFLNIPLVPPVGVSHNRIICTSFYWHYAWHYAVVGHTRNSFTDGFLINIWNLEFL
jgi:hypothetical protein